MTGDVRGLQPNTDPNATPPPDPGVDFFQVDPGSLGTASLLMLASANVATESYDAARDYLNANKSWMFSVASEEDLTTTDYKDYHGYANEADHSSTGGEEPTDPHPDWTQEWTAAVNNVLLAAADAIRLAGGYLDAINNAGQFYTKADKDSFMPELGITQA